MLFRWDAWRRYRRSIFYPKTDLQVDQTEATRRKDLVAQRTDLSRLSQIVGKDVSQPERIENAGTFHALFRIKINGRPCVLKLAPPRHGIACHFAFERWAMGRLEKAGLPSLKIVAVDESDEALGCPFLVMQEAPGRPLRDFENPETQALPEPALFELGRLLAQIHTIPGRAAGLLLYCSDEHGPIGAHPHWINYVRLRLRAHAEVCQEIGAINSKEVDEIRHIFTDAEPLLTSAPKRFLHGDPGHHNVFFDGQRITALIDWEDALVGDPVFDIAYWGTFVRDEMRARFLEGYRSAAALPDDFEHRYWLYYLRVALSKTVHRHHFGAKDRPGRPPASQRIQKALSKLREL